MVVNHEENNSDSDSDSDSDSSDSDVNPSEWLAQLEEEVKEQQQKEKEGEYEAVSGKDNIQQSSTPPEKESSHDVDKSVEENNPEKGEGDKADNDTNLKKKKEENFERGIGDDDRLKAKEEANNVTAEKDVVDKNSASHLPSDNSDGKDEHNASDINETQSNDRNVENNDENENDDVENNDENDVNDNTENSNNDNEDDDTKYVIEIGESLHSWYKQQQQQQQQSFSLIDNNDDNEEEAETNNDGIISIRHDCRHHDLDKSDNSNIILTVPPSSSATSNTTDVKLVYTTSKNKDQKENGPSLENDGGNSGEEREKAKEQVYKGQATIQKQEQPSRIRKKKDSTIDCVAIYDPVRQCHVLEIVNMSIFNLQPHGNNDADTQKDAIVAIMNPRERAYEAEKQVRRMKRKRQRKENAEKKKKISRDEKKDETKNDEQKETKDEAAPTETPARSFKKRRKRKAGKSGYHGVSLNPKCTKRPYRVRLPINGKQKFLGSYATAAEAARIYDEKMIELNGNVSLEMLNFPEDYEDSLMKKKKEGDSQKKTTGEKGEDEVKVTVVETAETEGSCE